jgi:putative (di)nucleoside polyphosphate hydrolase
MVDLPLRPNVCLFIVNQNKRIFVGERFGCPGIWQLPQGGIEDGISEEENALREAHEELGADLKLFRTVKRLEAQHWYNFSEPVPLYAVGRWRGQKQSFWLIEFCGKDEDINLGRFQPEFSDYCWATVDELKKKAEKKRLAGYEKALGEISEYLK